MSRKRKKNLWMYVRIEADEFKRGYCSNWELRDYAIWPAVKRLGVTDPHDADLNSLLVGVDGENRRYQPCLGVYQKMNGLGESLFQAVEHYTLRKPRMGNLAFCIGHCKDHETVRITTHKVGQCPYCTYEE